MRPNTVAGVLLGIGVWLTSACGREGTRDAGESDRDTVMVLEGIGLRTPESVLYDPVADVYLVSNINGSPFAADDNGFISRVSPDGSVLDLEWIDGADEHVTLNAPKGMTISGETLYVADLTVVRMFDRRSGASKGQISVGGSSFLNDLATGPDGAVYITDSGFREGFEPSGTDAVYRITTTGAAQVLGSGNDLARPNGIAVTDDGVWVAAFGSTELYRLAGGDKVDETNLPQGGLDGLVVLANGDLLVSSWDGKAVYRRRGVDGSFESVVSDVTAPADIGFDTQRERLLIPLFQGDAVVVHPLR